MGGLIKSLAWLKTKLETAQERRRWANLRRMGMHLGQDVFLPSSTWIDTSHCFLISIGDHCGFGADCLILAHDAQMDEFLDAARIGRVTVHESCHIGTRTVILPGVEIGPRTIVGAGSVVSRSLPPDSVCAGSPAKVICSLEDYLAKHRRGIEQLPNFEYLEYDIRFITEEGKAEMRRAVSEQDAYILHGRTAELNDLGGTVRTP